MFYEVELVTRIKNIILCDRILTDSVNEIKNEPLIAKKNKAILIYINSVQPCQITY